MGNPANLGVLIQNRKMRFERDANDLDDALRLASLYEKAQKMDQAEFYYTHVYEHTPTSSTAFARWPRSTSATTVPATCS